MDYDILFKTTKNLEYPENKRTRFFLIKSA
jgi:hypothetical protein